MTETLDRLQILIEFKGIQYIQINYPDYFIKQKQKMGGEALFYHIDVEQIEDLKLELRPYFNEEYDFYCQLAEIIQKTTLDQELTDQEKHIARFSANEPFEELKSQSCEEEEEAKTGQNCSQTDEEYPQPQQLQQPDHFPLQYNQEIRDQKTSSNNSSLPDSLQYLSDAQKAKRMKRKSRKGKEDSSCYYEEEEEKKLRGLSSSSYYNQSCSSEKDASAWDQAHQFFNQHQQLKEEQNFYIDENSQEAERLKEIFISNPPACTNSGSSGSNPEISNSSTMSNTQERAFQLIRGNKYLADLVQNLNLKKSEAVTECLEEKLKYTSYQKKAKKDKEKMLQQINEQKALITKYELEMGQISKKTQACTQTHKAKTRSKKIQTGQQSNSQVRKQEQQEVQSIQMTESELQNSEVEEDKLNEEEEEEKSISKNYLKRQRQKMKRKKGD